MAPHAHQAAAASSTLAQLVARSRRLGRDPSVCNWGGGNTSAKAEEADFRGRPARVLWVKGSGSNLATVTAASFTGLYLDDILPLVERERMSDTEMVDYLAHCFFEPGRPRPSIETLLHAFLPFAHIDHTHADATNFFACAAEGERLARDCFGDDLVWVPYHRPGFGLAREVALAVHAHPQARLVILAKHGLITWGETDDACYASTLATIKQARMFVERRLGAPAFGGARIEALPEETRRASAAGALPVLRGLVSSEKRVILRFEDAPDVLEFASSQDAPRLVQIGAACPDHLVHTKPWPLLVDWQPDQGPAALNEALRAGVAGYRERYERYLEENARQDLDPDAQTPIYRAERLAVDTAPRVILIPGIGMVTTGKDTNMAEVSAQLYHRAVAVMRGAEACGGFISLTDTESYAVEYWPLEQYKLTLAPPEREFARQVALVTGAAGGIGSAVCARLARDGAHIIATDIDLDGAEDLAQHLCQQYGAGRAVAVQMDVTNEESVRAAFAAAALAFGGIDIVVNNAGLASSAPITETTLADWNRNLSVLATGYFLAAREAFRLFAEQGRGGNLVFIASKNALVAGKNASAYSTAKAAELHLARGLAEEGGAQGIRVNVVNPDAVLAGSRIWSSSWRAERAATYGIAPEQLEEHYRQRTTLGVNILPEDIAEAVGFFASPTRASKSTGNILNVDGGVPAAFPR
ncbi:MAG TPA: bifunctional aldolase/short-chain dehydrogenase [Ktedonobacterales bacterium]|nr:bifunctional aldolase/short-chain dehydrogenase [Ktedonobacterales bacterium]